jgi:hypothetical protein
MLPADAQTMQRDVDHWQLRPDGQPTHGVRSIIQPVHTSEGARATTPSPACRARAFKQLLERNIEVAEH